MFGSRNNRNRPVCQFYLEGRCRYGDSCKNEHPVGQGGQNSNRFASLDANRGRAGFGANQQSQDRSQHKIEPDLIKNDLTDERPIWPLTSYGPGKNPPRNLISAEHEHSPEEMRLLHYMAIASGNPQETAQREAGMMQNMDDAVQKILSDLNGAVKYVVEGFDQHPNRLDLAEDPLKAQTGSTQISLGQPPAVAPSTQTSAFGQPSTFGRPSAFGQSSALGTQSSFGQPSKLGAPAFGQSSFGQPAQSSGFARAAGTPAFGQTGFGSNTQTTSAFGQASTPQSTFGKPSAFGAASQPTSTFGAPSQPQSTFGQPSTFGAPSQPQSAFGQPSALGAGAQQQSAFGQPSTFGANTAKPNPFGSTASTTQTSAFGAPSAFGAQAQTPSPFGAAATPASSNPFASNSGTQSTPSTQSAFGQTSNQTQPATAFGQPSQPSAFGQPSQPSAFGQPSHTSTFGQPSQPSAFGQPIQSSNPSQPAQPAAGAAPSGGTAHITADAQGNLIRFHGRPVTRSQDPRTNETIYLSRNPQTGKDERIWFPKGEPPAITADMLAPEACYQGEQGQQLEKIYQFAAQNGVFESGIMPEVPPLRSWTSFAV